MIDSWYSIYILTFMGGTAAALLLTPVFRAVARRYGFLDVPADNHKGHKAPTPLLGGAAMFCAWIICIIGGVAAVILHAMPGFDSTWLEHISGFQLAAKNLSFIVLGAALAVVLGLADDRFALSAPAKFGGQFMVALIAVIGGGVRVNLFCGIPFLESAATVFWIMLLMNSVNFFDNMDGLAAGTIAIAMGFFTTIAALNQQYFIAIFSALNFGVCCGFWFYNASPATVFMGDSGSHFLGYLAAVISAGVTFFDKGYSLSRFPVLIPALILALPLFDTAMVVLIRFRKRKPFWIGDHNHISHRFVKMGLSRKQAVLLVHLMALSIALGTLPVYWGDFKTAAILVIQAFLLLLIITLLQLALKERS